MSPQNKLRNWYLKNKRDLPFRKNKNPYQIWLSEIMLQQTRMNHMLPIYIRFIQKFPTLEILANSTEEEVIKEWRGLGYYSRAINLRKSAIEILNHHNGEFPKDLDEILKIKGIGPYTARAILSIAFNFEYAVLDGNVKRVLSRYFRFEKNISTPSSHKELQVLADGFLNKEFSSDHNQALMELGSLVCTEKPICLYCPLNETCLANQKNLTDILPIQVKEKKEISIELEFFLIQDEEKILLIKTKERRFFKTIFSIPFLIYGKDLPKSYLDKSNLGMQLNGLKLKKINFGKHSITHHKIELNYSNLKLNPKNRNTILNSIHSSEKKWVYISDLEKEFPSSIAKKLLRVIHEI